MVKGMVYRGVEVTLDNCEQIFCNVPVEVLDEIRLAVLDGVDILNWLNVCGNDSYKLGQIRLCLRECLDRRIWNGHMTGQTLHMLRNYKGELGSLMGYVKPNRLMVDAWVFERMTEVVVAGYSIDKVDFTKVPDRQVDIFCKGLVTGYPMELFMGRSDLSPEYIKLMLRGITLGMDVTAFLDGDWSAEVLITLYSNCGKTDMNDFLRYVTGKFPLESIRLLLDMHSEGCAIDSLAAHDVEGYPVYNEYQLGVLSKLVRLGVYDADIFNPAKSDMEMERLFQQKYKNF